MDAASSAAPTKPIANKALAIVPANGSSARAAWAASVIFVWPSLLRVAAHVTMTKKPITPVRSEPVQTSMRSNFKSSRVKRLSTA